VVRQLAAGGTAVCYTTHYLPELSELGATIAVAACGRIIARGSQRELLADRRSLDDLYHSLAGGHALS
jgi:ABC-2 type transport system ATP-binding protein